MKNKKILGALAALCMGIILCVSSVFAVNYWYSITDNGNNSTVTLAHGITLSVTNAGTDETGLYPGGTVTFDEITVVAPQWEGHTSGVENLQVPTFDLVFENVADTKEGALIAKFTKIEANVNGAGFAEVDDLALENDSIIVKDIQNVGASFTVVIRLTLAGYDAVDQATFEGAKLTLGVKIVESAVMQDTPAL